MNAILYVLIAAFAGAAWYFYRQKQGATALLTAEAKALEEKRTELERAKKEARDRQEDLENTRRQLQETKSKLKTKEPAPAGGSKKQRAAAPEAESAAVVTSVVHVSDRALEEAHAAVRAKLEAELAEAKAEIARFEEAEKRRKAEAEKAARTLEAQAVSLEKAEAPEKVEKPRSKPPELPKDSEAPKAARTPEEQASALEAQLEAFRLAAAERERGLKRELGKLEKQLASAQRRANGNHSNYLVIKGQLELAEDRLAQMRRRYEGAKRPETLRKAPPEPALVDAAQVLAEEPATDSEAAPIEAETPTETPANA